MGTFPLIDEAAKKSHLPDLGGISPAEQRVDLVSNKKQKKRPESLWQDRGASIIIPPVPSPMLRLTFP